MCKQIVGFAVKKKCTSFFVGDGKYSAVIIKFWR
jgi:hypothetical protein